MEITILKPVKMDIKAVGFNIPIYLGDLMHDGLDFDKLMYNFSVSNTPKNDTELFNITAKIDVKTGYVIGWHEIGSEVDIFAKVVDEGHYCILGNEVGDESDEYKVLGEYDGYVPAIFECNENGYGDYFNMTISRDGKIKNWHNNLEKRIIKMWDKYQDNNY
jgi:hypothetical protein